MTRILIVDDHPVVREGLKQILRQDPELTVAGEASTGNEALELMERNRYDLVLLDLSMPGFDGLEVLARLRSRKSEVPVLVLSIHPEDRYALRAIRAGAAGYLVKSAAADELLRAVARVAGGRRYISPILAEALFAQWTGEEKSSGEEALSGREYQVMRMLASGKAQREIADILCLSPKTVSTYNSRILKKMGFRTTAELIRYAVENHLSD